MRYAIFSAVALSALAAAVCWVPGAQVAGAAVESVAAPSSCVIELRFETFRGLILVPIEIGGSPPLDFILDSGANVTALNDAYLANALNLHYVSTGRARGVGLDPVPVLVAPDVAVRSEGRELYRTDLVIHHVQPVLEEHAGRSIHGLLGADLFERYVVEVDPRLQRLLLHDPDSFTYQGRGLSVELESRNRWPTTEGRLTTDSGQRVKVRLLLDTGTPATLVVIEGSHRKLQLPEDRHPQEVVGLGGVSDVNIARVRRLQLDGLVLDDIDATYIHRAAIPAARALGRLHGVLGTGLLLGYHSIIDVPHGRLILEPLEP